MEIKNVSVRDALQIILDQEPKGNMIYAQTYAKAALELGGSEQGWVEQTGVVVEVKHKPTGKMMIGKELKIQLLYILSNLSEWRGDLASRVKQIIAKAAK